MPLRPLRGCCVDTASAAPLRLALALALTMSACRHGAGAGVADPPGTGLPVTADGARQRADALLAGYPTEGVSYIFVAVQESADEFHVQYLVRRVCEARPRAVAQRSDDGSRAFTVAVDICPTALPAGTTIRVRKADGAVTPVGGE